MTTTEKTCGIYHATDAHHDACYARYAERYEELTAYRFRVADDLKSVEVTGEDAAANGIWTLAEILASGASWRVVSDVAKRMAVAIRRHKRGGPTPAEAVADILREHGVDCGPDPNAFD